MPPTKKIRKSIEAILVLSVSSLCGFAQAPQNIKQDAKNASCSNIVALAGSVNVNCSSLTPEQKKLIESIPALLNKILVNRLDPDAVMKKLDEILKAVNPNIPAKTYFCNGQWRTAGPGAHAGLEIDMGGDDSAFQEMIRLNNSGQYANLLKTCLGQIQSAPEWLTPRLLCSLAYLGSGDKAKAKEMLAEFESKTGPAYDVDACHQMSEYLHKALQ